MTVERGDRVTVDFTATYPDGKLFDTSYEEVAEEHGAADGRTYTPLTIVAGRESGIPSLQKGLVGMEIGEEKTIHIPHDELVVEYDPEAFEEMVGEPPEEGMDVRADPGLVGQVVDATNDAVAVDFDPDHSDQTLQFDVKVLDVK